MTPTRASALGFRGSSLPMMFEGGDLVDAQEFGAQVERGHAAHHGGQGQRVVRGDHRLADRLNLL